MEKVLDKVVSMVKLHSEGIPLKKLAVVYSQTYHKNLTLSSLGFSSVESLVSSLHQDLVLDGELVFHKDKWRKKQAKAKAKAKAGAGASCTQDDEITKKILEDVVTMMKDHPAGVPQKKVAIVYNQTYRQNLSLASLGFSSMSSLLEALSDDLVLMGDMVFYKTHQPHSRPSRPSADSRPQTPLNPDCLTPSPDVRAQTSVMGLSFLGPSLLSTSPLLSSQNPPGTPPLTVSKPAETPSQQMLYDRVIQVMKTYQLVAPSMDQLEKFYLQMFGEPLPRAQYVSLYDHWEASCPKAPPSQPTPDVQSKHVQDTPAAAAAQPPVWQADPQPSTSSLLLSADFPALSRDVSRERSGKVKDMPLRDSAAPVFKDGYHAQLREMLGGNMRAYEALEEDEEEVTGRRRRKALDQDSVNSLMEEVIREIAAEGEHVTREKVISRVCQLLQIPSSDVGRMTPWKFPALKDLQYIMKEINMFIECTEAVTSISTLYELGQSLAGLKDKKHFEELNLGPLCKLPLVHRMFKIDGNTKDDDVRQIRTVDILRQLRTFRRQVNKPKVDLAEFLKFLADHYNCDSPYELGIRIHSIGLPISTLMKVSRAEHLILEQARELIQRELEEEAQERLRKMKRSVLDPLQGASSSSSGNFELRKKYVSMTASEVVLAVFSNAEGVFSPKMAKHVQSFLLQVSGNPLMRALFQLSICGGSLAVPQDLVLKDKTTKNPDQPKPEDSAPTSLPSEGRVKQFVRDSLSSHSSAITLAHVANLEKKLTRHFQVKDFLCLRQGNFLEFLVKHVQLLQDCLGSSLILSSSSMDPSGSSFRPSRQDVFEFINQCGEISSTDPEQLSHIESALRTHFRVRDSRDLGFGALHSLADLVQKQRSLSGGGLSPVHYEAALFARHNETSIDVGGGAVGRLGEVSKDQALSCLLRCPLLEDLSEWSQWELVFKPRHGPLKDFIETNAGNSGLSALEVSPGQLLRITSHTGDRRFSAAVTVLDPVGAAGHLVSMVIADGIANAPTALLANHVQSSLAAAIAQEEMSRDEEDVSSYSRVAKFLLECFIRIPTRISQALLNKVFLEPFSSVLGQTKSKRVLIAVAQSDPRHLNCLHRLGILLGVTEWIRDFQKKLDPPEDHRDTQAAAEDHAKSNLLNSESSSLSGLNTSEDEFTEENIMDGLDQTVQPENGEHEEGEDDDGEEEEELYELTGLPNGETSAVSSEAEDTQDRADSDPSSDYEKSSDSQSETEVDVHRAIIEDIRKSEFGIGVELNAEGQKLMKVHQERLGRSLDRLSTELYSKDTHFVLELIQNADDNSYPSGDGVVPALAFVVERDCITILNNETGFQEKNIRAICDVGRSTKGKHKYGYIGQKGIGFKSVFKVTDCPEIHSNGFHLRFDKSCGPMGYILPHWAEDERTLDAPLKEQNLHSWTTKICLPLRSENHQTRNLFHDVHPSLLLFLHRLRSIVIYNQSEKRLVRMTRKDLSHSVLEVEHSEGLERWLVVKTMVQPKKIKENVESTELALAFQLDTNSTGSDIIIQPQKQPVFAYLPLRSFGFRFIIQGDFDIPSSREDVDRDSSWNQWLRSEIPQLFLKVMDVFTAHPEFSGLKGLCQFLQFVPLPDEVLDFFKPVAGQIIQLLKGKAFLPTLSPDGQLVYKLPSQIAVCQDAVIRDVIGGEELERHLSLSYLHPDLSRAAPTSLLAHLGVRNLRGSDVTTVTTAMAKELLQVEGIHSEGGLRQLARLLVCNFRALEHGYGEAESILQTLRELPIIPLADGRMVSLTGEGVFFPMEETKTKKKKKAQSSSAPLSALYEDVSVVHPSLLSCVDPLQSQQIAELLRRLGVHDLEPQQLLQQHIYPTIQSNKWKSKPSAVVVSYLVFIKQHSSSQDYADAALPVLTNRGLLCPADERVHFSEEYGNINLPETLPGCDWLLLSPCYVQTDGDVEGWRELFTRLGVRDGLIIRKQRQTLTAKDLACSVWSAESSGWFRSSADECVIEDFPCEEFQALASAQLSDDLLQQQRTNLLQLLNDNWDTGHRYSQYLTAQVVDQDGRPIRNTRSSFHHMLCSLPWVPAYQPQEGELRERRYLRPNSVYLTSDQIYSLLGTHVCYVDLQPGEFSQALGMNHTVSVDTLIKYLKDWCEGPEEQGEDQRADGQSEGRSFSSTVQHIHNVYTYLHNNCPQSRLKELFQHTPAVFIEYKRGGNGWCSGRFYHLKEVCWSDPTSMFQRYRQLTQRPDSPVQQPKVLAPFYSPLEGMKAFFTRALNVDLSPNMNQYVGLLELVCSSHPTPNTEILQDVSVLYARLALTCSMAVSGDQDHTAPPPLNPAYCSTLKGMVSDKRVFPTKENTWVSLSRRPMISDNKELEKVFKSHGEVCLLSLPPAEKRNARRTGQSASDRANGEPAFSESDRSLFLQICGVRRLSDCVKSEPQTENLRPCPPMQATVRSVVPYIQKFLFHHDELAEVYQELVESNISQKIKKLQFSQVGKLYIRYQLDVAENQDLVELQDVICLLKDQKELYIQKDHLHARLEVCRELVKLFCTEDGHRKELRRFLSSLMTIIDQDQRSLKGFLQQEDIRDLPADQELWEVPEPPAPEVHLERVLSRTKPSMEVTARPAQEDGEETLACWPPRASLQNTGSSRTASAEGAGVVEAVMKMWPPPAGPKDRDPEREGPGSSQGNQPIRASHEGVPPIRSNTEGNQPIRSNTEGNQPIRSNTDGNQPIRSSRPADQPGFQKVPPQSGGQTTTTTTAPQTDVGEQSESRGGEDVLTDLRPAQTPPDPPAETSTNQTPPSIQPPAPEAVLLPSVFQGAAAAAERPPLNLDFPVWSSQVGLEDMELRCQRPDTVVLSEDSMDIAAIGEWGEQLVFSFLCHWRDSGDPESPAHILWCNQSGESGQPYDFRLTLSSGGVVYVEVKATIKKEKSFIHLSANELDFALKEKDRYHIFRVYSAGDAANVRLCRIKNLAQHLHSKELQLYLFL